MAVPMPPPIAATSTFKPRAGGADTIGGAPASTMAALAKPGKGQPTQAKINADFNAAQAKAPTPAVVPQPVAPVQQASPVRNRFAAMFGGNGGAFGMSNFNNSPGPWGAMGKAPMMTGRSPFFGNFNGGFQRGGRR